MKAGGDEGREKDNGTIPIYKSNLQKSGAFQSSVWKIVHFVQWYKRKAFDKLIKEF